jgi:hypothetical protein
LPCKMMLPCETMSRETETMSCKTLSSCLPKRVFYNYWNKLHLIYDPSPFKVDLGNGEIVVLRQLKLRSLNDLVPRYKVLRVYQKE